MSHSYTWAALLGLLTLAGAAQAQPAAFGNVSLYSGGDYPASIVVADVNGDRRPDLLVSNLYNYTAGVLLGTGTGSFGIVTTYNLPIQPNSIAAADVNGDGRPDLLLADRNNGTVGIKLNTGTGGFGLGTTLSLNTYPNDLVVADVNGDGKLDVLTANSYAANSSYNTIGLLLGTGTGSFGAVTHFGVGNPPNRLAVADVNGDGKLDVVITTFYSSTIGVLLGTGTGSFGGVTQYTIGGGSQPTSLAMADVNGDGRPDLLTANYNNNTLGVLLGTGTGSFGAITTFPCGSNGSPKSLALADVNGDGKLDLLTANDGSNTAGVLLGTGTGSFGAATSYSTGSASQPISIAAADVNGDGRPDLLTANAGSNTVGVLLNTGTYTPLATTAGLDAATVALYPNPAHGRLQVAVPAVAGATTVQATLLDALGRVVRQQSDALPATGTTLTLETTGLSAGGYALRLMAGAAVLTRHVVLE